MPTDRRERWQAIQTWQSQSSEDGTEGYSQDITTVRTFAILEALDDVETYLRGKGRTAYYETCAYQWQYERLVLGRKCM